MCGQQAGLGNIYEQMTSSISSTVLSIKQFALVVVLGIEPKALCMAGTWFASEPL